MPSTSAEMSRSRMAMKARPVRVRNRLAAPSSISSVTGTITQYSRNDVSRATPNTVAGCSVRPAVPPVSLRLANRKWAMNEAAMVAIARYRPLTRSEGRPTTMPPSMATKPPASRLNSTGVPQRACTMATV